MRVSILLALLASSLTQGCLTEGMVNARRARYEADNEHNMKAALKEYLARHHLTEVAPKARGPTGAIPEADGQTVGGEPTSLVVVARPPAQGLRLNEWLLRMPDGLKDPGMIVFASNICLSGDSCGCSMGMEYSFATAPDGRVVVLRLNPRIHDHEVTQAGTCSSGCGMPSPPRQPDGYDLPTTDVAKVQVADVPYDMDALTVHCMHEIEAP